MLEESTNTMDSEAVQSSPQALILGHIFDGGQQGGGQLSDVQSAEMIPWFNT